MTGPLVSVIMSVYNGARDAPAAVRSILSQTLADFEFIAIDDGSFKDNSRAVLDALGRTDDRIRVVHLDRNIGLAGALNHGISLARGRYIARQDHDDISRPERFADQVAFMSANPAVGLLGTRAEIWADGAPTGRVHDHPTDNATLQFDLLFNNPFVHSSVMIRRDVLDKVGVYTTDSARQPPEDYELWSRIARVARVANLPVRHLIYVETAQSMSRVGPNPFRDKLITICAENLAHANGRAVPDQVCLDAAALVHAAYDRVQPGAKIDVICELVTTAARRIEAENPGADLGGRSAAVLGNLNHHHGVATHLPGWLQTWAPLLRRLPLPQGLRRGLRGLLR